MSLFLSAVALWVGVTVAVPQADHSTSGIAGQPTEFTLDRNETQVITLQLAAGEYLLTVDTRRVDGQNRNLIGKVSLLDGDGVVVRDATLQFNAIDVSFRGVSAFHLRRATTVSVRVVNEHDRAEYMVVVHALPAGFLARRSRAETPATPVGTDDLPFNVEKAGAMPYPFFGTTAPAPMALDEERSGELADGDSAYYALVPPRGDYRAVLGFTQTRRASSNLIGYVALLDSAGGSQQLLAQINAIDVSFTEAGSFTLKRPGLVVLRVANRHANGVKYTLRVRQHGE